MKGKYNSTHVNSAACKQCQQKIVQEQRQVTLSPFPGGANSFFCSSQIKIPRTLLLRARILNENIHVLSHTYLSFKFAFGIMFFTVISCLLFQKVNLKYNGPLCVFFNLVDALSNKRSMLYVSGLYIHHAHTCISKRLPHLKTKDFF